MVDAVYGSLELLLYGVLRLVIDIDFEHGTFEWVDTKTVLSKLSLTPEEFLDACMLAGFDFCGTFPPLLDQAFTFRYACEMVKNFKTGYAAIRHFASNPGVQKSNYMDLFLRARCVVRHHPIYTTACICEPLHKETGPGDIHEVVGPRLPNDLYFLLSQGVILPQVVNNLTTGVLLEAPPNVDSEEYRRMLNELTDLRSKTLGLLTGVLHESFSSKRVASARWYDFNTEYEPQKITYLRDLKGTGYRVPHAEISAELGKLKRDAISIPSVIAIQAARSSNNLTASGTIVKSDSASADDGEEVLTSPMEVNYTTLLHVLIMRDFLTSDNPFLPTVLGKSLEEVPVQFQEEALLILELIKYNFITPNKLTLFPPTPLHTGDSGGEHEKEITFISRIVSILPMKLNENNWTGPLDHDLMGFHEIVKALYRSLRNALEMTFASLFLSRRIQIPYQELARTAFQLPFFSQNSTSMGVAVKTFLISNTSASNLRSKFPNCLDLTADLKVAYAFWEEVMKMTTFLVQCEVLPPQLFEQFSTANTFFLSRRHLL